MRDTTPDLSMSTLSVDSNLTAFVREYSRRDAFAGLFGSSRAHYLGRYRLLDLVGMGGMGVVFAAHDETLDRKVAIKLVRPRGNGHERMLRESQALARLSHPNVVHVYEIGEADVEGELEFFAGDATRSETSSEGGAKLAFIVMEFVDGVTLDAWLAKGPTRAEILEVFASAGRGLAAAHTAGIVHRDFKPQNVMLGHDGRVHVMDFGLARYAKQPEPAATTQTEGESPSLTSPRLTQTEAVLGTPLYMAPEQLAGQVADERSDQFGFCVALHEALYGQRPFEAESFTQLVDRVSSGELAHPTGADVPSWLARVVRRGLAPDPEQRWPSMDALLAALADDPARRRRKQLRALGFATTLVASVALASTLNNAPPDPPASCTGLDEPVAALWNDARQAEFAAAFAATELSFASDTWARVRAIIDDYVAAWTLARVETCESAMRGERSATFHDASMACLDEGVDHLRINLDLLAKIEVDQVSGAVSAIAGLPSLERCADFDVLMAEVALPTDPAVAERVDDLREQLVEVKALQRFGDRKQALALAREVRAEAERLGYEPLNAEAIHRLAAVTQRLGQWDEAVSLYEVAYGLAVEYGMAEVAADTASALMYVSGAFLDRQEVGLNWAKSAGPWAKVVGSPLLMGGYLNDRGLLAQHAGEYHRAVELYSQSVAVQEHALEPWQLVQVAKPLYNLGALQAQIGEFNEAREALERSLAICESTLGSAHPDLSYPLGGLAELALRERDYPRATAYFERAVEHLSEAYGPDNIRLSPSFQGLGTAAARQGQVELARQHYQRARDIAVAAVGPGHKYNGIALGNLAQLALRSGDLSEARSLFEEGLAIIQAASGPEHPDVARMHEDLGEVARLEGALDEARTHFQTALDAAEATLGPDEVALAGPLVGLGEVALERGDLAAAIDPLERALDLSREADHEPILQTKARYALARALWQSPPDRERALELAGQAHASCPAREFRCQDLRATIEAWLGARE